MTEEKEKFDFTDYEEERLRIVTVDGRVFEVDVFFAPSYLMDIHAGGKKVEFYKDEVASIEIIKREPKEKLELAAFEGEYVRIETFDGETYEAYVSEAVDPNNNYPEGLESIVVRGISKYYVEFFEYEIKKIEIIEKKRRQTNERKQTRKRKG